MSLDSTPSLNHPSSVPDTMEISLLFLSCRRLHYLRRTLAAIRRHLAVVEPQVRPTFICFDNGSSPEDRLQLSGMGFDRLLLTHENLGIGPAMNQLVSAVRTPYFLNLQDDWAIENPEGIPFVRECIRFMESDARVCQIKLDQCHFLDFKDRTVYDGPFQVPGGMVPFFVQNPQMLWGGMTFPPALSRTAAVHALGPFLEDQPFRRGWAESEYSARSSQQFVVAKSPRMVLFKHIGVEHSRGWTSLPESTTPASVSSSLTSVKSATDAPQVACLLTAHKRPHLLARQLEAIRGQTVKPAEIALWHNFHPNHPLDEAILAGIPHVRSSNTNWGVWPRFLFCQEFTSPYVCVFDDDTIPGPRWLESCLNTMAAHEGLLGTIGIIFRDGTRGQPYKVGWCNPNAEVMEVDLVGHAWFFKRDWLRVHALEPRQGYSTCGEDYHFSVALQKHLGLGTYVPPHDPQDRSAWGSTMGDAGNDEAALYRQPGESDKKARTHRAYLLAGWRPLALRNEEGCTLEEIIAHDDTQSEAGSGKAMGAALPEGVIPAEAAATTPAPRKRADFHCNHDFEKDFDLLDFRGPPFAFARFGDGELALCTRRPIRVSDGWSYDGADSFLSQKMREAIFADMPGYYLGVSCPCCDPKGHAWYMANLRCPAWRVTYANLFVNGNYERFLKRDLKGMALVSSTGGDFTVPRNAISPPFDYRPLLEQLFRVDRPILVAAGPLSCILIHDYWQQAPNPQVIVDIGSTLDPILYGHPTRGYHHDDHPNRHKNCVWSDARGDP